MLKKTQILTVAAAVALSMAALPSFADTVTYDFDPVSGQSFGAGSGNTSVTVGNATFTQANAAQASYSFAFGPNSGLFSNIGGGSGTVLSTGGNASVTPSGAPASLTISFASTVYGINFNYANSDFFGSNGGDTLTATIGGTTVVANPVSTYSANNDLFAEGAFAYTNANGFNSITLTSTDAAGAEDLVLGDLSTQTTPVPLPSSLLLFAGGLLGLCGLRRRSSPLRAAVFG
jgi:hypothetical protein